MSSTPCRFGWDCHRPDCWYAHPNGRAIDNNNTQTQQQQQQTHNNTTTHAAINNMPYNPAMLPLHMQQMSLMSSPLPSSSSSHPSVSYAGVAKPITSSNLNGEHSNSNTTTSGKKSIQVCRYGRECRREECWFSHPDGREIEDKANSGGGSGTTRGSPSLPEDYDEALAEFEGEEDDFSAEEEAEAAFRAARGETTQGTADHTNGTAHTPTHSNTPSNTHSPRGRDNVNDDSFHCPCCNGDPAHCTTPTCVAAGICACQADRIEGDDSGMDETWRDEWFPASRTCSCCDGYVYRCKKQQPQCEQGRCACNVISATDASQQQQQHQQHSPQAATAS